VLTLYLKNHKENTISKDGGLIFESLENQENKKDIMVLNLKENQTLRGLVRDYLGSRSSSEFFDNVDDFLKSMHDLYNYDSKEVIVKLHRKL
jgi:hypothetical protein